MDAHPYHLTLQASGLYGLAVYSPVLDEIVDVPPEFLDYELARIGELLNTPPLMNSREDVVNGSMPSNASRNSSSSTSLPSSDRPVPLSSPSSDPLSSSDKWTSSRAAIRLAPVREAPKASRSPKAVKLGDGKESKWERREVTCLGCRTRKCRCEGTHPDGGCNRCATKGIKCLFEPVQKASQTRTPRETGVARPAKRARTLRPAPYAVDSRPTSLAPLPAAASLPPLPSVQGTQHDVGTAFDQQFINDPVAYQILLDVLAGKLRLDSISDLIWSDV